MVLSNNEHPFGGSTGFLYFVGSADGWHKGTIGKEGGPILCVHRPTLLRRRSLDVTPNVHASSGGSDFLDEARSRQGLVNGRHGNVLVGHFHVGREIGQLALQKDEIGVIFGVDLVPGPRHGARRRKSDPLSVAPHHRVVRVTHVGGTENGFLGTLSDNMDIELIDIEIIDIESIDIESIDIESIDKIIIK